MLSRVLHSAAQASCRRSLATSPRLALATHTQQPRLSSVRPLSSSSEAAVQSRFAIVDHSDAYVASMRGPHGKQLELAQLDGMGKDDPPFNPFWDDDDEEEEYEEEGEEVAEVEEGEMEADDENDQETAPVAAATAAFNNDGSLRWKKGQLATFRAGAPAGGIFAVVELAGSQHKVTTDDVLNVNLLKPVELYQVGSVHTIHDVMMVGSSHQTAVGMPYVTGAEVDVMVEEITQDEKVVVFKKRRRKNYKRKKGHRRDLTLLRILDIRPPPEIGSDHEHVLRENPTV